MGPKLLLIIAPFACSVEVTKEAGRENRLRKIYQLIDSKGFNCAHLKLHQFLKDHRALKGLQMLAL